MEYPIIYHGRKAGQVRIKVYNIWVLFQAECSLPETGVFRCYGRIPGQEALLLGVLEPVDSGKLALSRSYSMTLLHQMHAYPDLPGEYFLIGPEDDSEKNGQPAYADVADALIRAGLEAGQIQREGNEILCRFEPGAASPMPYLLTVCRLERRGEDFYAVYQLPPEKT